MTHSPGRRNGREHWTCPACGRLLAYARREMLILRRLTVTDDARSVDRDGETVRIRCRCGKQTEIDWSVLQK